MNASLRGRAASPLAVSLRWLLLLFFQVGAQACAPAADGPLWTRLAHAERVPRRSGAPTLAPGFVLETGDGVPRLVATIPADAFRRGADGVWQASQPVHAIGRAGEAPSTTLSFPAAPALELVADPLWTKEDAPARYQVGSGVVRVEPGVREDASSEDGLPGPALLSVAVAHQLVEPDGRLVVAGRRAGGEGLCVWPGERVEVSCDVPPDSALRFACAKEAALLGPGVRLQRHTFRVLLEGALLFEREIEGGFESVTWFEIPLPRGGGRGLHFRFEVDGPQSFTSFLDPTVGPAEVGRYGERPWTPEQRDVVFFLADTFRADNLAAYGGKDGRTPNLDAFAERSLLFRNAWSVSTHTLPTHATFFSGLYPRQIGQVDFFNPLPRAVDTLAEMLARNGYRTVAITDGVMVSQTHGMAQGFQWFDERRTDLDGTLARVRAALVADDGRPLFLFVQSYASHAPYEVRASTRAALGDRFFAERNLDGWLAELAHVEDDSQRIDPAAPGTAEALAGIAALYAAGVVDLDRGFGELLATLEESGVLAEGSLLVTSDHGEALGEHERVFHAGVPFDEVLRVPLLVAGRGIEPRRVDEAVSLIDIAPTIAALAGVRPLPGWLGSSFLERRGERPVFAFQCRGESTRTTLAVIRGNRKLIGYEDTVANEVADWWLAYDLARDPLELEDLLAGEAEWPSALAEELGPRFVDLLTPRIEAERPSLSADALRALDAMGYGGGGKQ